jgi:hypothetical protein
MEQIVDGDMIDAILEKTGQSRMAIVTHPVSRQ